jgi:bifunctional non-homologous end joining protein LigD
LQVCTASAEPPAGDGWLHEIKHDGHRLLAMLDGAGGLRLLSMNGYNRTELFRAPFDGLVALGRALVLVGEIALPDERGRTHIGDLQDALARSEASGSPSLRLISSTSTATTCAHAASKSERRCSSAC